MAKKLLRQAQCNGYHEQDWQIREQVTSTGKELLLDQVFSAAWGRAPSTLFSSSSPSKAMAQ